ncbi:hypothetical protein HY375_00975 [Candidatus Berkelbacteria bacterium]|nr:hypothetical protein [Candidatus Berkelbacteria bacterium]
MVRLIAVILIGLVASLPMLPALSLLAPLSPAVAVAQEDEAEDDDEDDEADEEEDDDEDEDGSSGTFTETPIEACAAGVRLSAVTYESDGVIEETAVRGGEVWTGGATLSGTTYVAGGKKVLTVIATLVRGEPAAGQTCQGTLKKLAGPTITPATLPASGSTTIDAAFTYCFEAADGTCGASTVTGTFGPFTVASTEATDTAADTPATDDAAPTGPGSTGTNELPPLDPASPTVHEAIADRIFGPDATLEALPSVELIALEDLRRAAEQPEEFAGPLPELDLPSSPNALPTLKDATVTIGDGEGVTTTSLVDTAPPPASETPELDFEEYRKILDTIPGIQALAVWRDPSSGEVQVRFLNTSTHQTVETSLNNLTEAFTESFSAEQSTLLFDKSFENVFAEEYARAVSTRWPGQSSVPTFEEAMVGGRSFQLYDFKPNPYSIDLPEYPGDPRYANSYLRRIGWWAMAPRAHIFMNLPLSSAQFQALASPRVPVVTWKTVINRQKPGCSEGDQAIVPIQVDEELLADYPVWLRGSMAAYINTYLADLSAEDVFGPAVLNRSQSGQLPPHCTRQILNLAALDRGHTKWLSELDGYLQGVGYGASGGLDYVTFSEEEFQAKNDEYAKQKESVTAAALRATQERFKKAGLDVRCTDGNRCTTVGQDAQSMQEWVKVANSKLGDVSGLGTGQHRLASTSLPVPSGRLQSSVLDRVVSVYAAETSEHLTAPTLVPTNYLKVTTSGAAVGILLTDPAGRNVGYNPVDGSTITNVEGATYDGVGGAASTLLMPGIVDGQYTISFLGLGDGTLSGSIVLAIGDQLITKPIHLTIVNGQTQTEQAVVDLTVTEESIPFTGTRDLPWWFLVGGIGLILVVVGIGLGVWRWLQQRARPLAA